MFLGPCVALYFWVPEAYWDYAPLLSADEWRAAAFMNAGRVVCGVALIMCSYLLKSKPKRGVALGPIIIVLSLLDPAYTLLVVTLSSITSINMLLYVLSAVPIVFLGNILGVIGGLCAIFGWKSEIETKGLSKETMKSLLRKNTRSLLRKKNTLKKSMSSSWKKIDVMCLFHLESQIYFSHLALPIAFLSFTWVHALTTKTNACMQARILHCYQL